MVTATDCDKQYSYPGHISQNAAAAGAHVSDVKNNIGTAIGYKDILITGNSDLQLTPGSLGSRQFRKTSKLCKLDSGEMVTQYNFDDNTVSCHTPDGNPTNCGLMAGLEQSGTKITSSLAGLLHVFDTSPKDCTEVTIDVINGCVRGPQKAFVETTVVADIDPCAFSSVEGARTNPVTQATCPIEGFTTKYSPANIPCCADMPKDPIIKIYYTSIGLLMLYIVMKMTLKK
jgi:hypothetical protein